MEFRRVLFRSYDNRSQKIALSFAKLLNEAGVKFAILGNKEKNSGDTPRRLGNEFLFHELATKNIDAFVKNDVNKLVTIDPHRSEERRVGKACVSTCRSRRSR